MKVFLCGIPADVVVTWVLQSIFPGGASSWVDIACGNGEFTRKINFKVGQGIGVDVTDIEPHLPVNFSFERIPALAWIAANKKRQLDIVSSFEFVEHIEKEEALRFIAEAKTIGQLLVLSTPSGFLKQDSETDPSLEGNPWLWHRCGFSPEEFESLGFMVFVLKNAHYKPKGNKSSFDKLIVCWGKDERRIQKTAKKIKQLAFWYNLIPLHLYRTVRDVILRPRF